MARTLKVEILGDSSSVERAFARAAKSGSAFGGHFGALAATVKRGLEVAGAAAAAGAVMAVKAFDEFESSMSKIEGLVGVNHKTVAAWSKQLIKLGPEVAKSPKELADALFFVTSAGFRGKAAIDVLTISARASAAGLGETKVVADAVTSALNAYKGSGLTAAQVTDTLVAAVREGKMPTDELAQSIGAVMPVAAEAGVSFSELAGMAAALSRSGADVHKTMIGVRFLLAAMINPTSASAKALKSVGISADELRAMLKEKGLLATLQELKAKLPIQDFLKVTGGARGVAVGLGAVGKNAAQVAQVMQNVKNATGSTDRAFEAASKTGLFKWKQTAAAARAALITFGGILEPLAVKASEFAIKGLGKIQTELDKIGKADGFKLKVRVVWQDIDASARDLTTQLQQAITGHWTQIGDREGRMMFHPGLQQALENMDWDALGQRFVDGLASGLQNAATLAKRLAEVVSESVRSVNWVQVGRVLGPGIAAAFVSAFVAITDPAFWIKNWDLALAVALTVFGKGLGKIAPRLGLLLGRTMEGAFLRIAEVIARVSPKLADEFLNAFIHDFAAMKVLVKNLGSWLGGQFGKLGRVTRFAIKVIGIQAAISAIADFAAMVKGWIDKVVNWFKGLPGRIIKAIGHPDLSGIGKAMVQGLIDGMGSMLGSLVKKASDLVHAAKSRFEFWHSPPEAYGKYIGAAVAGGIAFGISGGTASVVAAAGRLVNAAKVKMNAEAREVARIQAQIDAAARAREDRDNRKALADAQTQFAEARKKGKGIADAERAVQDALAQIRDTARQRDLDKSQRNYDKLQKAYDAAQAKLEKAQQKAADNLQKMQDRAGTAFDRLAAKIQTAFGAKNDAWVAPAQQAIDAIMNRRSQEDLRSAADDAAKAYQDALLGGDPADIARKLRDRDRALEDIKLAGLERDTAIQQAAHQQMVDAQQEALDAALEGLRASLTEQGMTWDKGLSAALGIISKYVGPFSDIGKLLGKAFADSLAAAATGAADAGAAVAAASGKGGSSSWVNGTNKTGPYIGTLPNSGTTKIYKMDIARIDAASPEDVPRYFRNMERLGL